MTENASRPARAARKGPRRATRLEGSCWSAPPAFKALVTGDIRGRHLRLHLCCILDPRGVQVAKVYKARVMTAIGLLANDRAIGVGRFAVGTGR